MTSTRLVVVPSLAGAFAWLVPVFSLQAGIPIAVRRSCRNPAARG